MTHGQAGGLANRRVAVIGDVGGHTHALRRLLERLGVVFDLPRRLRVTGHAWTDVAFAWPEDLHVVQVGDLVHRGPDSLGVVLFADRMMRAGRWTQVLGNHEQLYVASRVFQWTERIPDRAQDLLREWWGEGWLRPAVAVSVSDGRDLVVTHGGVTHGFWSHHLDRAGTATEVAQQIAGTAEAGHLWRPGLMLTGRRDLAAGPVWAEAGGEVQLSWLLAADYDTAPFDQAHGHSSAFAWSRSQWICPDAVRPYLKADTGRRHVVATIAGARITGVDPGHATSASSVFAPLVVTGRVAH